MPWTSVHFHWLPCSLPPRPGAWHSTHNCPRGSCRFGARSSLVHVFLPFLLAASVWQSFPISFGENVCLLQQATATGGKKPRGLCRGHLHPCVSGLAVPSRPCDCPVNVCRMNRRQAWMPPDPVASMWGFGIIIYSHQDVPVTVSSPAPITSCFPFTTCGMAWDTPVSNTWARGKHTRLPGLLMALWMPGALRDSSFILGTGNPVRLSQAHSHPHPLPQTFLLMLGPARCRGPWLLLLP